jgi:hypothetical protein
MKRKIYRAVLAALMAATVLGGSAVANAQAGGSLWDSSRLPETKGTVKQYTLTPRGDIDGLILNDGTEVKLPPHLTNQIAFAIRPGDAVTVRGLRATMLPLIDAMAVTNFVTGATVVDNGPPDRSTAEQTISGRIVATLHGKQGEVNGAVLDNGTNLRLPPPEAERIQQLLAPGGVVTARGPTLTTPLGTVIDVTAIGSTADQLTELAVRRRPDDGPRGPAGPRRAPFGPADFGPPPRPPRG